MTGILFEDKFVGAAMEALRRLERKYGREMLSSGYAKLMRLSQVCQTNGAGLNAEVSELIAYCLQALRWALDYEYVKPRDITQEWLDKSRDGTLGFLHLVLSRRQIWTTASASAADVPQSGEDFLQQGLAPFRDYQADKRFSDAVPGGGQQGPKPAEATEALDAPQGLADTLLDTVSVDSEPVELFKGELKGKAAHAIVDLFYDLLACNYDQPIRECLANTAIKEAAFQEHAGLSPL